MLVTFRREGESILIGADIEVQILDIRRSKVKLGIVAPRSLSISTHEIDLVRAQNRSAASCNDLKALSAAVGEVVRESPLGFPRPTSRPQ
jgi:carbon storage regulator